MSEKILIPLYIILCFFLFSSLAHAWVDGTPFLLERFADKLASRPAPHLPHRVERPLLKVGDQKNFHAVDFTNEQQYVVSATLRSIGDHCYIFVADEEWNAGINSLKVEMLRRTFEESTPADSSRGIYQLETDLIGLPPDIDNDTHIYILLLDIPDSYSGGTGEFIAGYFNPVNQQHGVLHDPITGAKMESNEVEMVYLDTDPLNVLLSKAHAVLAHEFQHLIHWGYDRDEEVWVNEGCSDYAMFLCGYAPTEHIRAYEESPNVPLTYWPHGMMTRLAYYGAVYLWMLYLHEHYGGENAIRAIIRNKANGISGINSGLFYVRGEPALFDSIFTDWKIANYLDDMEFEDGRYGYKEVDLSIRLNQKHSMYPVYQNRRSQDAWSSDYISFRHPPGNGNLIINFSNESPYKYDVKLVEFDNNRPISIKDMKLSNSDTGSVYISDFGKIINQVVMIPSIQPSSGISDTLPLSYSYEARIGEKVRFRTNVLPNPVHPSYWDIVAVSNENIGEDGPMVTVTGNNNLTIAEREKMRKLENGNIYTYQIYLPAGQSPKEVKWEIYYFDEKISSGRLSN